MYKNSDINLSQYPNRMNSEQVAEALGLTQEALNIQLSRGSIVIPFVKIGKAREFLKSHVESYLEGKYEEACNKANDSLEKAC